MGQNNSDEMLLERYALGDPEAFEQFFLRHRSKVYFYVLKRLHRPELAIEALQDIFLKLHARIHQYRIGEPALPWFFTIVHHACIDAHRKLQTSMHLQKWIEEQNGSGPASGQVQIEHLVQAEIDGESRLGQSLASLPADQRELVAKRVVEGQSFKAIAQETGKSEVALRKSYSRAIDKLRQWFLSDSSREGDE
ncbi:RNA polymerase sigma factor [bacterium]|nr:RNA polymerase sigma factor [bacterium]